MNTRNRNALITLAVFAIVLVSVWPLAKWKAAHIPPDKPPPAAQPARARRPTEFRAYTGPMTNFLGQEIPLAAEPYLASAVRCARVVAADAEKYPIDSNAHRMLKGLEQRLWEDDYAYAALVTGGMNRTNALAAYAKLDEQPVAAAKGEPLPNEASEGSQAMSDYYHTVADGNPSYSNIVQTLARYTDRSPFETDLLKDAGMYSAYVGQSGEWVNDIQKDTAAIEESHAKTWAANPEIQKDFKAHFLPAQDARTEEMHQLLDSYRTIFGYRIAERDGINDPSLLNNLAANPLIHAGPEFRIP